MRQLEQETEGNPLEVCLQYRNTIYFFTILWIAAFHLLTKRETGVTPPLYALKSPFQILLRKGFWGVDIFLFLSGVCSYLSYAREPGCFFKRRFSRLFPTIVLVSLPIFAFYSHFRVIPFLWYSSYSALVVDGQTTNWYVLIISVCYIAVPTLAKAMRCRLFMVACLSGTALLFSIIWWPCRYIHNLGIVLMRIPVFVWGMVAAKWLVLDSKKFSSRTKSVVAFLSVIFCSVMLAPPVRGPYGGWQMGLPFTLCALWATGCFLPKLPACVRTVLQGKFIRFVASSTFEIYLLHLFFRHFFMKSPFSLHVRIGFWGYVLSVVLVSGIISVFFVQLVNQIAKGRRKAMHVRSSRPVEE